MPVVQFLRQNARFLLSGGLLALTSSYGQTFFISIFAAQIMAGFGLSAGGWGGVYMAATMASAVAMFWAGALTDRFRVRALALLVLPGLALTCVAMGVSTSVAALLVIVFFLRLFGQGMCSHLAVVAMARWFNRERGLALSVSALGYSVGTAFFPVLFAMLLGIFDWRTLWLVAAGMVVLALPILWRLLAKERTPQSMADEAQALGMGHRQWSRPEVLRHPLFWLLLPMLLGPPTWGTALFFQQVHIADIKGWALPTYLAMIPLMTVVAVTTTILSGRFIDRFGTPRLARIYLFPWVIGFAALWSGDTVTVVAIAFVFFGMGQGMQATLPAAFWSEFYGTRHIGAIKAAGTSVMVLGSALGPGISGAIIDMGVTFPDQMIWIAGYFLFAIACVWIGVARYAPLLPGPSKPDIIRA